MLPQYLNDRYQAFLTVLEQLQRAIASTPPHVPAFRQRFTEAQQLFQQQIMSLDTDDLTPAEAARLQSYLTEINKQMRLLGTDVTFWQAARSSATVQQRQAQIGSRLETLIDYCQAVLEID